MNIFKDILSRTHCNALLLYAIFEAKGTFGQKKSFLLATITFFTYFCRSTNKVKEYEHKTEKIYLARGRNS